MAKNFSVEVLISTAKATKDLQAAEGQVRALDRSLANLSKTIKASNGDLAQTAKSIAGIVASSQQAAKASEQLASAKIKESKAQANSSAQAERSVLSAARTAQASSAAAASKALETGRLEANTRAQAANAASQINAAKATDQMGNSLANQRYLLYDVGATYRTLALAAQALPAASLAVAASYEKNFAQVIRTSGATGAAVGELKNELKALGTEIPMSFAELSEIAKIGGQMDIPAESLGKFTEVVAKFVATADGVTIDKATESFGRMANLFAQGMNAEETSDFFERLGSAISYTADNSVTSEAKISSMLEKIAPIGKSAGLSAVEITSFASALSSVGLAPEISSGFLTRFFGGMNKDIANNSDTLQVYNKILGTTSEEFAEMYRQDPSAVLTNIVTELSKLDKIGQTKLLGELGVTGVRDIRVIQGLAQNLHVLEKAQKDTAAAFETGTYLDESSAGIFNTFAANLQKMATAIMNLGETMGSSILPVLSPIVQGITEFATGFDALLTKVPALKGLLGLLLTFSSLVGVWLAVKSAQAFVTAGLIGFQHVAKSGTGATLTLNGQVRLLATTMLMAKGATDAQAASMLKGATATQALRIAMGGTVGTTNALSSSLSKSSIVATGASGAFRTLGASLAATVGNPIVLGITALTLLGTAWYTTGQEAKASAQTIVDAAKQSGDALNEALGTAFATEKVGVFDTNSLKLVGKTYQEIATMANASLADISTALGGTTADLDAYIKGLRDARREKIDSGQASYMDDEGRALEELIRKLGTYRDQMSTSESATRAATEANGGLAISTGQVGDEFTDATMDVDDYTKSLNDAIAMAFGMVDAQGAVEASLEKLGAGLAASTSFGADSEGGRANLANLQATLASQALLFQQHIEGGRMTAEQASSEYANFVQGLMGELAASGVDPAQIEQVATDAMNGVQNVFNGQSVEMPVSIDTSMLEDTAVESVIGLANWLGDNPLTANMSLEGADQAAQDAYEVVSYIAEATGLPFEAVIDAITNPAAENSAAVMEYIAKITAQDYKAEIGADTSVGISNVRNFAIYAQNQIGEIMQAFSNVASVGAGQGIFAGVGALAAAGAYDNANVLATPAVNATKANKALIPTFDGIKRGYNGAQKAAGGAGKAAGGAGKAAKKAGTQGKKAGKELGKAAKEAKKDWDEAEQAISGYASRIGTAFGYVFDKTQGVAVAKDEYYTVLNGIKSRLDAQKQSLRDLRAENKSLNAERAVQLNDAAKLEKMAKYADAMGNPERAKYYRDEAKALKASADESKAKVDQNNKEIRTIEKGIGNLKGYSQAAIDNRAELRTLEKAGLGVAEAYAKSGASAKTVREQTVIWTGKAKDHSKQLGYSKKDIEGVTSKTSAYITMLKKVPKTINTKVNETKTTTLSARNNTSSGVNAAKKGIRSIPGSKTSTANVREKGAYATNKKIDNTARNRTATITIKDVNKTKFPMLGSMNPIRVRNEGGPVPKVKGYASGGTIPGTPPNDPREDNLLAKVDGQGHIAVRSGEFIQRQEAVDYYGSDIMNKINNMDIPRYALGGGIGRNSNSDNGMSGVIDLSSETIQSIARLIERDVYLFANNEQLANSVNKGNQAIAQKGGHGVIQ